EPHPPVIGPPTPAAAAGALAGLVAAAATVGWLIGHSSLLLRAGHEAEVEPRTAVAMTVGSVLTLVVLIVAVAVLGRWAAARSRLLAEEVRERRAAEAERREREELLRTVLN